MNPLEADLAAYYDQEAGERAARDLQPRRVEHRAAFVDLLVAESRRRVVEIGTGPGVDAQAFLASGLAVSGVDLSPEHVRRAREVGVEAVVGSVLDLPWADRLLRRRLDDEHPAARARQRPRRGPGRDRPGAPTGLPPRGGGLGRAGLGGAAATRTGSSRRGSSACAATSGGEPPSSGTPGWSSGTPGPRRGSPGPTSGRSCVAPEPRAGIATGIGKSSDVAAHPLGPVWTHHRQRSPT